MKYDITKQTAPKMPRLGKGTECVKVLLSQVSKDMHEPLIPMLFPILGAHVSGSEFHIPTLFGRNCVAKWTISSLKVGVTRDNCHF